MTANNEELRRATLWRDWFWTVTIAEMIGFGAPAIVGALTVETEPSVAYALLVAAGSVEGLVLGVGQATVLARVLPHFPRTSWAIATAVGAACAWSFALLPMLFDSRFAGAPAVAQGAFIAIVAIFAILSIGSAQWTVLRRVSRRAGEWILASSIAWCAGLLAFGATTTPLWNDHQSTALTIAIGVLGGLVMAATMAAVTGSLIVRILTQPKTAGSLELHSEDYRPSDDNVQLS